VLPRKVPMLMLAVCPGCQKSNPPGRTTCIRCKASLRQASRVPARGRTRPYASPRIINDESQSGPLVMPEHLLIEGQDPDLAHECYSKAHHLLSRYGLNGENIEYLAVGIRKRRGGGLECAVATNKRLIVCMRKKKDGQLQTDDCFWRDMHDIQLVPKGNAADLVAESVQGLHMEVRGLPETQARWLYEQGIDYSDRLRAKFGLDNGSIYTTGELHHEDEHPTVIALSAPEVEAEQIAEGPSAFVDPYERLRSYDDPVGKMKRLRSLLDAGLITEEDYEIKKAEILSKL
jgi:Short C-terminal domain